MAKTATTLGTRRQLPPQLPEILPKALEAARNVSKLRGWETVSAEIEQRERRHPHFKGGTSAAGIIQYTANKRRPIYKEPRNDERRPLRMRVINSTSASGLQEFSRIA